MDTHIYTTYKTRTWKNKQQTALLTQHGNGQGWAERPLLYVWFVLFLTVGATHAEQQREQTQKKKLSSVWWEVPSCQSKLAHPRSSQELYLLCPTGLQKLLTLKWGFNPFQNIPVCLRSLLNYWIFFFPNPPRLKKKSKIPNETFICHLIWMKIKNTT